MYILNMHSIVMFIVLGRDWLNFVFLDTDRGRSLVAGARVSCFSGCVSMLTTRLQPVLRLAFHEAMPTLLGNVRVRFTLNIPHM